MNSSAALPYYSYGITLILLVVGFENNSILSLFYLFLQSPRRAILHSRSTANSDLKS